MLDPHSKAMYTSKCHDTNGTFREDGKEMMNWIDEVMANYSSRSDVIWKASSMHHPLFALHYDDFGSIISDYLPKIDKGNFDIYFAGHEH